MSTDDNDSDGSRPRTRASLKRKNQSVQTRSKSRRLSLVSSPAASSCASTSSKGRKKKTTFGYESDFNDDFVLQLSPIKASIATPSKSGSNKAKSPKGKGTQSSRFSRSPSKRCCSSDSEDGSASPSHAEKSVSSLEKEDATDLPCSKTARKGNLFSDNEIKTPLVASPKVKQNPMIKRISFDSLMDKKKVIPQLVEKLKDQANRLLQEDDTRTYAEKLEECLIRITRSHAKQSRNVADDESALLSDIAERVKHTKRKGVTRSKNSN